MVTVEPFKNGTVSKGPIRPGLLVLVNTMLPLLLVVVLPLAWKANRAAGGLLFGTDASTAGTRRLGLNGVVAVLLASMAVIGVVGAVTLVTAVPVTGLRVAPVKNGVCVVCTPVTALANAGVTPSPQSRPAAH